jgi:hypothetical protein
MQQKVGDAKVSARQEKELCVKIARRKSSVDHGKVNLAINRRAFLCDVKLACREHNRAHPWVVSVQHLLRKTSVTDWIKVKEQESGGRVREARPFLLDLLLNFFLSSTFFSSRELKSSEEEILKRNTAQEKKGPGPASTTLIPTSDRSMDELCCD